MTKNDALYLAYILFPFALVFICVGVFAHIKIVSQNHMIDIRTKSFQAVNADVNKFIIREFKIYHSSGKGTGAYNDYHYRTFVDVDYAIQGKVIKSFGKLTTHKSVEDAVSEYDKLPNRPPLFYQQGAVEIDCKQSEVLSFLSQYQIKAPFNTEKILIKYSPDKPEINSLATIDKKPFGGILIPYGMGFVVLAIYILFCYLGNCIEGARLPLFVGAIIVLAFAALVKVTYKVSIDRTQTFVPGVEKQVYPK